MRGVEHPHTKKRIIWTAFLLVVVSGVPVLAVEPLGRKPPRMPAPPPTSESLNAAPETNDTAAAEEAFPVEFIAAVLGSTEDFWRVALNSKGPAYTLPKLVLFSQETYSGCGRIVTERGPVYCSEDDRIYLDLDFLERLTVTDGRPSDFAAAYVIAHEVGHHVQTHLYGMTGRRVVASRYPGLDNNGRRKMMVRYELQADCLAGVWANSIATTALEVGDIEEALGLASRPGPANGTAADRMSAFMKGFEGGAIDACDMFP